MTFHRFALRQTYIYQKHEPALTWNIFITPPAVCFFVPRSVKVSWIPIFGYHHRYYHHHYCLYNSVRVLSFLKSCHHNSLLTAVGHQVLTPKILASFSNSAFGIPVFRSPVAITCIILLANASSFILLTCSVHILLAVLIVLLKQVV